MGELTAVVVDNEVDVDGRRRRCGSSVGGAGG